MADEQFLEVGEEAEVAKVYSLVRYEVTEADIAATRAKYAALSCDTKDGYEEVRLAIGFCRETRVKIESRRQDLKRAALEYGRKVDSVAKHLTGLIREIEEPLKEKKLVVDNERERVRAEKEAAEKAALEAQIRAEQEAAEAARRAERAAEEARLAEERQKLEAERERLDREASALKAQREEAAARAREEEARLERQREELRLERERQERAEFERQAKIRAEEEAKVRMERERVEAEEARRREEERQAEHARRIEAMKPDIERVRDFGRELLTLAIPDVQAHEAREILDIAWNDIRAIAAELEAFGKASE
jgi:chromosome segregation ATPase